MTSSDPDVGHTLKCQSFFLVSVQLKKIGLTSVIFIIKTWKKSSQHLSSRKSVVGSSYPSCLALLLQACNDLELFQLVVSKFTNAVVNKWGQLTAWTYWKTRFMHHWSLLSSKHSHFPRWQCRDSSGSNQVVNGLHYLTPFHLSGIQTTLPSCRRVDGFIYAVDCLNIQNTISYRNVWMCWSRVGDSFGLVPHRFVCIWIIGLLY